jgi:hypothetical protein
MNERSALQHVFEPQPQPLTLHCWVAVRGGTSLTMQ